MERKFGRAEQRAVWVANRRVEKVIRALLRNAAQKPHVILRFAQDDIGYTSKLLLHIVQQRPELAGARGMPQLPQGFGLDLPNALARDVERLADFFQSVL